ncbi:CGNR zinc finger domain-containing protein [Streptomyces sp. NPDC006984]|uniref:CGNR zinc finger domain-containing protein n=1 Tax=Streptomyces sp. NPDC006984 TaxID=3155463 RepID=UPI00340F0A08
MTDGDAGRPPAAPRRHKLIDAGRLCLDLLATAPAADGDPEPLSGAGELAHWLTAVGLLPAGTRLPADRSYRPAAFRELRCCLAALVDAELEGSLDAGALRTVNGLARRPPPGISAVPGRDGGLVRELSTTPTPEALLAAIARDAVDLLTDPAARGRLRRCRADGCRRVFLDSSRGGQRRWCSGEVCGNRARVARHRRRSAPSEAPNKRS